MERSSKFIEHLGFTKRVDSAETWRVNAMKRPAPARPLLRRLFARPAPTTYQRCLAVHLYFAEPHRGLS
ncbi:MAG TPA: hypothetical protein VFA50_12020 [Stellaceae bacterium]|nr:hypothetical protein [Stellaceae bacterium]